MLKLTASLLVALLAIGCAGVNVGPQPLTVIGQVRSPSVEIAHGQVWTVPSAAAGVRIEVRKRQRGGLFQRFRWQVGEPVARTVSDTRGRFELVVPPGTYFLVAHHSEEWTGCSPALRLAPGLSDSDRLGAMETITVHRGVPLEEDLWLLFVCER